jgi:serine/threonine protein kinase/predicted Zn-dependent protease
MDHPNVARVLDAGATEGGRPYFVMELVQGVPLTRYCDEHRLTVRQRLELFVPVCRAVQHAHTKGIIHRDLKPSNVLVALYDGRPVPKVIDFGIAKATGPRLTERTLFTEFGSIVGTLEYMSPEQAELNQLDVDTRSDVYSLGVILYELLTGTTPLDRQRLPEAGVLELLRRIREEDPPKPSTRLSTTEELPAIAASRGLEPRRLSGLVRGELDWIVMRALEKDRGRRYETANAFAMDLERYLRDEPVLAGPPGAGYRLRKFLRRHKGPVLAAALVVGALVAGIIGTTCQAVRATLAERLLGVRFDQLKQASQAKDEAIEQERAANAAKEAALERERAEKEAKEEALTQTKAALKQSDAVAVLVESVFRGVDPEAAVSDLNGELVRRLDEVAARLEKEYAGDALVQARLRNAMGLTRLGLGEFDKAAALFRQALNAREAALAPDHPDTLESQSNLGEAYRRSGQMGRALLLHTRALEGRRAKLGPDDDATLESMNFLAMTYVDSGDLGTALPMLKDVLNRRLAKGNADDPLVLSAMNNLAQGYVRAGRLAKAVTLHKAAWDRAGEVLGPDHPATLQYLHDLAVAHHTSGQFGKALPLLEEAVRLRTAKLGPEHPHTLRSTNDLAGVLVSMGEFERGLELHKQVWEKMKVRLGPDHPGTLVTQGDLALAYHDAGQLDKAVPLLEDAVGKMRKQLGADHPATLICASNLGKTYLDAGRIPDARKLLEETLGRMKARFGPDYLLTLKAMNDLGVAYLDADELDKALELLAPAREKLLAQRGADDDDVFASTLSLGTAYSRAGQPGKAIPLYEHALANRRARRGAGHPETLTSMLSLAGLYEEGGRYEDAVPLLESLVDNAKAARPARDEDAFELLARLAIAQERREQPALAEPVWVEAVAQAKKAHGPGHAVVAVTLTPLAVNRLQRGKYAEAEACLREALAIYEKESPDDWARFFAVSLLGASLTGQKKYAEAEPLLLEGYEGLKKRAGRIPAQNQDCLTQALRGILQLYEARDKQDQARKWRDKLAGALYERGATLTNQGQAAEGEPLLREVVRLAPTVPEGHLSLSIALMRLDRVGEAEAEAQEVVRLRPRLALAHHLLGQVYGRSGQRDKAVAALERALELGLDNCNAACDLAALRLDAGDVAAYRRGCRRVLERFGTTDDPGDAAFIARTCALLPFPDGDAERVLKLADRAVTGTEKHPLHTYFQLTKALAEYRAGEFTASVTRLQALAPKADGGREDATAFTVLALAQHRLGQTEEARAALANARAVAAARMADPREGRPFGQDWSDWVHFRILYREAEGLLTGAGTERPAPERKAASPAEGPGR